MPRQTTILQVFLSSPNDLEEERSAVAEVIADLNRMLAPSTGLTLELIRWETHTRPGIGRDTQDVISSQLPSDYDIFLGMMWGRFGTPTGRAGSGTVEEFEEALARRRTGDDAPSMMFYFKAAAVRPLEVDPSQLGAVHGFRRRLQSEGILYKLFESAEDLQSQLRIHLSEESRVWQQRLRGGDQASNRVNAIVVTPSPEPQDSAEVEGIFDLLEQAQESFGIAAAAVISITQALEQMSAGVNERVAQLNVASTDSPHSRVQHGRTIAKRLATDMIHFVSRADLELPVLSEHLHEAIRAYGLALSLAADFGPQASEPLTDAMIAVESLQEAMMTSMEQFRSVRQTIALLPRVQKDFNAAKRQTVRVFDTFLTDTRSATDLLAAVAAEARRVLLSLSPSSTGS